MKAALLSMLTNWRALTALLVVVVAFAATFVLGIMSQTQAILLVAAWIGGVYTFFIALFEAYFEHLHERSGNE